MPLLWGGLCGEACIFLFTNIAGIMLRITPSKSANGAVNYFDSGLSKADYYTTGVHTIGQWHGKAAKRLGLEGEVSKQDFAALCFNRKPGNGKEEKLNPRDSNTRKVGYDFTFSAPKSASAVHALNRDERIREAFEESVTETMQELEQDMRTQSGQGSNKQHVKTGNIAYAKFTHLTTRPVDGVPDPHLHAHCYVMNTTWHEKQQRFQAGELGSIVKDAPYYEAAFDSRFSHKMAQMGYKVEKRGHSWEIAGLDNTTLQKFSRRTVEVEKAAAREVKEKGFITAKQKDKLGGLTRASKRPGQSYEAVRYEWLSRLSAEESGALHQIARGAQSQAGEKKKEGAANEALNRALAHSLERKSTIGKKQLLREGLKRSYGEVLPEEMQQEIAKAHQEGRIYQQDSGDKSYITTDEAVKEEKRMVRYVREGRGTLAPINPSYRPQADFLNKEQKAAIRHTLQSSDRVIVVAGKAGTGKTTLMKEVKQGIEAEDKQLFGFAPSAAASRGVMREEGFERADTLQQFIVNEKLQAQTKGQVIWIDEAGMVGNKTMNKVFEIAKEQNARILLTGDIKQHNAVAAGDALRIIEERGGINVARVNTIQRQRPNPHYKEVVTMIAEDRIEPAIQKLDRMGGVIEIADSEKRVHAVVQDYVKAADDKKTALVVSPTHQEGNLVTQAIRTRLKEKETLQGEEKAFLQLKKMNLTEEQKRDASSYEADQLIQFHQNAPGFRKGERWQVLRSEKDQLHITNKEGRQTTLPLGYAQRFTPFKKTSLSLAAGDRIRVTQSGKTMNGSRIHNGDLFTLKGFTQEGDLQLTNGKVLPKDFGHVTHGYVSTSHSAQGKTVQRVFIVQSELSKPASSKQQFYVSISRGREMAKIYTDDKIALQQAVSRDGKRMTASQVAERDQLKKTRQKYWDAASSKEKTGKVNQKQHGKSTTEIA